MMKIKRQPQSPLGQAVRRAIRANGKMLPLATAISAILATPMVHAADAATAAADSGALGEIVVTAQKRTENLQSVPISIDVFDTQKIEQLHVVSLDDYVKLSPSVSYSRGEGQGGNGQPGTSHLYMRGVVSGANENHSGSQPSVGEYLDEMPVTTIDGNVDVHIYDVQRIEVLEGPQGTFYGASSEAGTVRIITNKPDPTKFEAAFDVDGNHVQHGGNGYSAEGFVNIPLSSNAAVRVVGWYEKDAGYIDNVAGTNAAACIQNGVRTYQTWAQFYGYGTTLDPVTGCVDSAPLGKGAQSNAAYVKNNYNTVELRGARAALKWDPVEDWSITPTVMGQSMSNEGFFGYDPAVGDLQVTHFGPEYGDDNWMQSALTVNGKISDLEVTYASGYMKRTTHSIADYSDYSEFYDKLYQYGQYWHDNAGAPIDPQELVVSRGSFEKWSHELRIQTPQDWVVHATLGGFIQRQLHNIYEQYVMPGYDFTDPYGRVGSPTPNPDGLASDTSQPFSTVPGYENTIWVTKEQRVDRDKAIFAQVGWDITSQLSLNLGERYFWYNNSLQGYYGYASNQGICFSGPTASVPFTPCTDLSKQTGGDGNVPRVNVTYKITPDVMVYATFSKGFRPGGVNRTAEKDIGPYQADFLTNYEVGWKTQWFDRHLRWNGAAFQENWNNFQFSFLGPNSVTIIENGGNARIRGIENNIEFQPFKALDMNLDFTFLDPRLTKNYYGCTPGSSVSCPIDIAPITPAGSNLPISSKFKGALQTRYTFNSVGDWAPFAQMSYMYQTQALSQFKVPLETYQGPQPAYGLLDLIGGASNQSGTTAQLILTNVTDKRAQLSRFAACSPNVCQQQYISPAQPRTIGIKFSQKF
ncbi:MAG TPA: TonB-dependent receptor [Steroidobacteraceae bacterium]|jgi:outer membrane receptor protein involved in Fe transport